MFFQYHGLHEDIIFNRGPQFASKFWKQLFELLSLKVKLSSTIGKTTWKKIRNETLKVHEMEQLY
jgi:hypothetical protein